MFVIKKKTFTFSRYVVTCCP